MDKKLNKDHKVNKNIFLAAFLFLLIFLVAGYSGIMLYDNYKKDQLQYDFSLLDQQILLNDLYNTYLEDTNSVISKCEILENQLNSQIEINKDLFNRLRQINKNAIVTTDNELKQMYVLTNIKLWLHYKKIETTCDTNINGILYFYPEIVGDSNERAKLDAKTIIFQKQLKEFNKVCGYDSFALPYVDYIPIINQIIKDYNVVESPAAVINGKIIYDLPSELDANFLEPFNCSLEE